MIRLKNLLSEEILNEAGAFHYNDNAFIDYINKSLKKQNLSPVYLHSYGSANTGALNLNSSNGYNIYVNYSDDAEVSTELKKHKIVVGFSKKNSGSLKDVVKSTLRGFDSMSDAKKYAFEIFKENWPLILSKSDIKKLGYTKKLVNAKDTPTIVPKTDLNKTIKNPDTGRMIKIKSALGYDKKSKVYNAAKQSINKSK